MDKYPRDTPCSTNIADREIARGRKTDRDKERETEKMCIAPIWKIKRDIHYPRDKYVVLELHKRVKERKRDRERKKKREIFLHPHKLKYGMQNPRDMSCLTYRK